MVWGPLQRIPSCRLTSIPTTTPEQHACCVDPVSVSIGNRVTLQALSVQDCHSVEYVDSVQYLLRVLLLRFWGPGSWRSEFF